MAHLDSFSRSYLSFLKSVGIAYDNTHQIKRFVTRRPEWTDMHMDICLQHRGVIILILFYRLKWVHLEDKTGAH